MPPDYTFGQVIAVKALAAGEATPDQQKEALDWIINSAAGYYEISFRSDDDGGDRETAFAEGRRFVGQQIVKFVNLPAKALAQLRKTDG